MYTFFELSPYTNIPRRKFKNKKKLNENRKYSLGENFYTLVVRKQGESPFLSFTFMQQIRNFCIQNSTRIRYCFKQEKMVYPIGNFPDQKKLRH